MKEVTFTLEQGKEVPARLHGTEIRYTLPTTPEECLAACGGDKDIFVSVFNEGYNLNHRQKIAKRFAAREGSTVDTIMAGVEAHKPGIRVVGEGKSKTVSARKQAISDMESDLAKLPPELQAKFKERLAALKPVKKAKVEGATAEGGNTATPAATEAPKAAEAGKGGKGQK